MMVSNLQARINEFFNLQGFGAEDYENNSGKTELEAADCFMNDLSFGTAGLRAEMDVGFNRMNIVTVRIATAGIAAYLKEKSGSSLIVLGYDHRHNSKSFAFEAAQVYEFYGHRVRMFPGIVPTPFVPSAIRCFEGAVGLGVMITASHNPRRDNGYKVYGGNGAQIGDQVAKEISEFIKKERVKFKEIKSAKLFDFNHEDSQNLLATVKEFYMRNLRNFICKFELPGKLEGPKVVYTALHGVGGDFVDEMMTAIHPGHGLVHVEDQRKPDPDFPTVDFPNPEEGRSTLNLAMKRADSLGINVIFANDPDADRFCFAEKEACSGDWRIYNGNEIAVLLADFIAEANKGSKEKFAMLASCVSSRFLKGFCERRGWHYETTATGFKNLGNCGLKLKEEGVKVLLAYEEAIGFQVGDWNFDKDGISALITFYTLYTIYTSANTSLLQGLRDIYERESCWPVQCNGYYFCKPAQRIKQIINAIDNSVLPNTVKSFTNKEGVVTLEFEVPTYGWAWLMLRSSGTEPKLKFYSELMSSEEMRDAEGALERSVNELIDLMISPAKNDLIKKK